MLKLLTKLFIKDGENVKNPAVRRSYGTLCAVYGIFWNIVLFIGKYIAGILSASVAITADAFNNLSDAGSSVITLFGFALAGKKPDPKHPFGHGRVEYLAGLLVSAVIIQMGYELGKSSVEKIIHPQAVEVSLVPALILVASILVKVYMYLYNRSVGKKIDSAAMQATAADSLTDSVSTLVVLLSMGVSFLFHINIDPYAGLAVAIFILFTGVRSAMETISPLLGQAPEKEFLDEIESIVMSFPQIVGIHDLIVHDYGPGRVMISLHAEVDGHGDIFKLHDAVDNAEHMLQDKLGCLATIHLDPIDTGSPELNDLRKAVAELIDNEIDRSITIHDFRMVPGETHTNIIFDAVAPQDFKMSDDELEDKIKALVNSRWPDKFAVVNIDRAYV